MTTNVLLCGVGGQGIITASAVLSEAALLSGADIKKSEVHGMSQRGGSVESHVRFSLDGSVHSPLIPAGEADVLLGFELLETLRKAPMLGAEGVILTDTRCIAPMSVSAGPFEYPPDALERLQAGRGDVRVVEAFALACDIGEPRAANLVMLGAASGLLDLDEEAWRGAIGDCVPAKALEVNLKAFETGREVLRP